MSNVAAYVDFVLCSCEIHFLYSAWIKEISSFKSNLLSQFFCTVFFNSPPKKYKLVRRKPGDGQKLLVSDEVPF